MALFELWSTQGNEFQDPNSGKKVTKKHISPGKKIWIRKRKAPDISQIRKKGIMQKLVPSFKRGPSKQVVPVGDPNLETSRWELGAVLSRCGEFVTVQLSRRMEVVDLSKDDICLPANDAAVDDMTELHYAHESAILHNLKIRALKKQPYSFIGNVLVSINPLQDVEKYIEFDAADELLPPHPNTVAERAFKKMVFASTQRKRLDDNAEYIGRQTEEATQQFGIINQSIIISGESGSGKTEAAKRVLKQLVEREGYGSGYSDSDEPGVFDFQDNIMGCDPILESFGSARTARNPNSSRFGKFLQLNYEPCDDDADDSCFLCGAKITTYLLERSRVTYQEPGERNYKIFYQLLTSPNDRLHHYLGLKQAGLRFKYLNNQFSKEFHDKPGYINLRTGLKMVKLGSRSIHLFQVIAAVLHLGNIEIGEEATSEGAVAMIDDEFKDVDDAGPKPMPTLPKNRLNRKRSPKHSGRGHGASFSSSFAGRLGSTKSFASVARNSRNSRRRRSTAGSAFTAKSVLSASESEGTGKRATVIRKMDPDNPLIFQYSPIKFVAKLLGVEVARLEEMLLLRKVKVPGKGVITKRETKEVALQRRDAMAKHIYALLFDTIVAKMNESLRGGDEGGNQCFIGILDVFGFEEFKRNSFEQLMINYANEVLLALFAKEILIGECEIYREEGLMLNGNDLPASEEVTKKYENCLNLFEGIGKNPGLLQTIDIQQRVPQQQRTDKKLLQEFQKNFSRSECFLKTHPKEKDHCFIIKHYASSVTYQIENFLQKNDQSIPPDLEDLFRSSRNRTVRHLPFYGLREPLQSTNTAPPSSNIRRAKKTRIDRRTRNTRNTRNTPQNGNVPRATKGGRSRRPKPGPVKKPETVCAGFSKQMSSLKNTLLKTSCSYIRCVKPNPTLCLPTQVIKVSGKDAKQDSRAQASLSATRAKLDALKRQKERKVSFHASKQRLTSLRYFEDEYVSKQLKNLGVYECVNVLKAGLPTRIPYPTFLSTFSSVVSLEDLIFYSNRSPEFKQRMFVSTLMKIFQIEKSSYKLGRTRIFFRSGKLDDLKDILKSQEVQGARNVGKKHKKLMREFTRHYTKRMWMVLIAKARILQLFNNDLLHVRAIFRIQKAARHYLFAKKFSAKVSARRAATKIQKLWRGYRIRKSADHGKAEGMRNEITGMLSDFAVDFDGVSLVRGGSKAQTMEGEIWEDVTLFDAHDEDSLEFKSVFSQPTENNALRGTLQSYFNRRTTYNRKTKALSRVYGTRGKKISERNSIRSKEKSLFQRHISDLHWDENIELAFLEFDGEDAEPELNPIRGEFADNGEYYDSYDDSYSDDQYDDEGDGIQTEDDNSEVKTSTGRVSQFTDISDQKTSLKTRNSRTPSQTTKRRSVDAPEKNASDSSFRCLGLGDTVDADSVLDTRNQLLAGGRTQSKTSKNRAEPKVKFQEPEIERKKKRGLSDNSAYSGINARGPIVNKLNPKKSNFWEKRETAAVEKKVPVWQQVRLRKVERKTAISTNTEQSAGSEYDVSKAAQKWGTQLRRVGKN